MIKNSNVLGKKLFISLLLFSLCGTSFVVPHATSPKQSLLLGTDRNLWGGTAKSSQLCLGQEHQRKLKQCCCGSERGALQTTVSRKPAWTDVFTVTPRLLLFMEIFFLVCYSRVSLHVVLISCCYFDHGMKRYCSIATAVWILVASALLSLCPSSTTTMEMGFFLK